MCVSEKKPSQWPTEMYVCMCLEKEENILKHFFNHAGTH